MLCIVAASLCRLAFADTRLETTLAREVHDIAARGASAAAPMQRVEIELGELDPRLRLAPCAKVEPYLPPGIRLWAKSRIGLRCVQGPSRWNVYLPITVKVYGRAWVAQSALPAGAVIAAHDLREAEVDWAAEPGLPLTRADEARGRVLSRPVAAGQTLRPSALQARQWFAGGDAVRIVVRGAGFAAASSGQALTPGIEGRSARVRTEGGRVVSGSPVAERRLEVSL